MAFSHLFFFIFVHFSLHSFDRRNEIPGDMQRAKSGRGLKLPLRVIFGLFGVIRLHWNSSSSPGIGITTVVFSTTLFVISIVVKLDDIIRRTIRFEEVRDSLFVLDEQFHQIWGEVRIIVMVVERGGEALIANAGGASCKVLANFIIMPLHCGTVTHRFYERIL